MIDAGYTGRGYAMLGDDWGLYGEARQGWDIGNGVETNMHENGTLSLGKGIHVPGFAYLTIGPALMAEHFDRNLSGFTAGQGGYFSPDHMVQGVLAINYLTLEGKKFLLKGSTAAGAQQNHQDIPTLLPLHPDGRTGVPTTNSSVVVSTNVDLIVLVNPNWEIGGYARFDRSASYDDFQGGGFVRYFFEPRNGVFASDMAR